jgi:hypothetical protein
MKKVLVLLTVLLTVSIAGAQGKFIVKGGLNHTSFTPTTNINAVINSSSGFHAGIGYQVRVPLIGLAIQPELLYSQKSFEEVEGAGTYNYSLSYMEVPINIQWGINLLLLRPFVFASPYVSYAVSKSGEFENQTWDNINRLDYGVGLGAGVEIWKFQISGKYNWSMKEFDNNGELGFGEAKFNGFQLSVALMF